jgi:hypothetical protein
MLNKIASLQGRRDEVPNQELARELAESKDREGIQEIAANLWSQDQNVQSDCLKVLYEIGYLDQGLIADYLADFLKLLHSRNNRLVWGGMIALATIAGVRPAEIDAQRALIQKTMEAGSVITMDNGVKILAVLASKLPEQNAEIFHYLLRHLETCRPQDVPRHAEQTLVAVNAANKASFIQALELRMPDLVGGQVTRVKKVIKEARNRLISTTPLA